MKPGQKVLKVELHGTKKSEIIIETAFRDYKRYRFFPLDFLDFFKGLILGVEKMEKVVKY